jgi:hypothetical protein
MKILPVTAKLMKQWHNRTLPGFKFRVLTDQTGLNYISPHTRSVIQDLVCAATRNICLCAKNLIYYES